MLTSDNTRKAWANSVPASKAPPGVAPSGSFLRTLKERFPTVQVRWDRRPRRRCFVLWEKTRSNRWEIIQDIPTGSPLDQRVIDHLTLCSMAAQPGMQAIISAVDEQQSKMVKKRTDKSRKHECDWDRVLWAARREARDALSVPMGVFSQVPK